MAGTDWFDSLNAQYQSVLGRNMDPTGKQYWQNLDANTGASDADLQKGFLEAAQRELAMRQTAPQVAAATYQMSSGAAPDFNSGGYGDYKANPYLDQIAQGINQQRQFALGQDMNGIRSNAVGVGGLGGSRQGVAEGVASGLSNQGYSQAMGGLYGSDFQQAMNRGLDRYKADQGFNLGQGQLGLGYYNADTTRRGQDIQWQGMDHQYDLGLRGLDNQRYGMDQNFYTQQRGQDLQGAQIGANIYTQGVQGGWIPIQNAANTYGNFTGFGSTSQSGQTGGGAAGAVGGAIAGGTLARNMGWGFGGSGVPRPGDYGYNSGINYG